MSGLGLTCSELEPALCSPMSRDNCITTCMEGMMKQFYLILAEVPSVAWVLNGLLVDAVYLILLLYPPENPVPSFSLKY